MKKSVNKILAVMYIFLAAFSVFFIAETKVHAAAPILENSNLLKIVPRSDGVQGENLIYNPTFARSAKDKNPPGWYVFVNRYDMQYVSQPVEALYPFENVNQKVCSLIKVKDNTGRGPWAYGNAGTNAMIIDAGLPNAANFAGTVKGGSYSNVYEYHLNTGNAKSNMGITLLLAQTVKVKPGSTYRFGMRSWANNGVDAGHRRYVVIYPNKFVSGPDGSPAAYYGGQETADMFSTYTVPDGVTEITVSIRLALPAGQKEVHGDIRGLYLEEIDDDGSTGSESGAGTVQPVKVEYYKDGTLDTETELSDGMLGQGYTVPEKDYGNNYVFDYAMVNGEKVDSLPVKGYFSTSEQTVKMYYKQDEKWLPDYREKWLDSETETIPKKNAFVMMRSSKTEIIESETSPEIWNNYQNKVLGVINAAGETLDNTVAYPTNKEQHITFSNVGYYNGESINVTVSIKPDKAAPDDNKHYSYIGLDGKNAAGDDLFLDISLDKLSEAADIDFQFKNSEGDPIEISGYWTFSNINDVKDVVLPISKIKNIYSISREYEQDGEKYPVMLKYEELATSSWGEKALKLSGVGDKLPNQISATVTYDKQSSFKYRMVYKDKSGSGFDVKYIQGSDAKVEIPDPQGLDQSFDIITAENYPKNDQSNEIEKPINYQFIQFVPFESNSENFFNRDQAMRWVLPELELSGLAENGWKIFNEDGEDVTNLGLFTFNPDTATITAEIDKEELYNHYFTFQVDFRFDDANPVDPNLLDEKYFTIKDEVKLLVDELSPVKTAFQSKINFAAEAEFEPVYRDEEDNDTIKPIPESSTQTEKDLLITHNYQEITPPAIDGYEYADESIPANYAELPVRYTQAEDNKVQLLYVINGELFFDIPEEMNFQKVSIPTIFKKTEYLQTIDPDWAIKVTDERSAKQRTPWKLSAQIADQSFYTHTDSEYQSQKADSEYEENIPLMSNILRFANADGAANDLTQSVVIYDSGDEPQAYDEYPIQWTDKNTGFFLDLQAFGYYPEGKYRATIDFTIEYVE